MSYLSGLAQRSFNADSLARSTGHQLSKEVERTTGYGFTSLRGENEGTPNPNQCTN